jgi:hypothetical protein
MTSHNQDMIIYSDEKKAKLPGLRIVSHPIHPSHNLHKDEVASGIAIVGGSYSTSRWLALKDKVRFPKMVVFEHSTGLLASSPRGYSNRLIDSKFVRCYCAKDVQVSRLPSCESTHQSRTLRQLSRKRCQCIQQHSLCAMLHHLPALQAR